MESDVVFAPGSPVPRSSLVGAGAAAAVAAVVVAVGACDGRGGPGGGEPGDVFEASDVRIVGTSESIGWVRDMEVLPDGSIWVLNSAEPLFVGFDTGGALFDRHGSSGGGPREFRGTSAFVTGGIGGEAWVFDFRRHSLVRASSPEGGWSEIPLSRDSLPPGSLTGGMNMTSGLVRTARLGDEILLPRTTGSMDSGIYNFRVAILGADLFAMDVETGSVRRIMSFAEVLDDPGADFELTEGGFPLWYRLWAVCGENRIAVYDRARNQVRRFTGDGAELEPMELPPVELTEATPREFARAVFALAEAEAGGAVGTRLNAADSARLMNELLQRIQGSPRQLADYLPRYVDFRCDEHGTAWIQPYDVDAGNFAGESTWLRLTADGGIREVRFPDRFDPFRFLDGRVWGVQRDELDVASVAWIGLRE